MLFRTLLAVFVASLLLFFWSGFAQILPWGVPTAQVFSTSTAPPEASFATPQLVALAPHSLTTPAFEQRLTGNISTLLTDQSFSWIISKEASYYNPTAYLSREYFTQLLAATFLVLVLSLTRSLSKERRLGLAVLMGVLATVSTYGQLFNWWGLPLGYTLGVGLNLIIGYALASAVLVYWVLPTGQRYRSSLSMN